MQNKINGLEQQVKERETPKPDGTGKPEESGEEVKKPTDSIQPQQDAEAKKREAALAQDVARLNGVVEQLKVKLTAAEDKVR